MKNFLYKMLPDSYHKSGFNSTYRVSTDGEFLINLLNYMKCLYVLHNHYDYLNFNKYGDASLAVHICTLNEIIKIFNGIKADY